MKSDAIALFGIPIDRVDMGGALQRIVEMVAVGRRDERPRLVATVNVDFVVNSLALSPEKIRHPELLDILCGADLVTADGMPLVWLSRLLGAPLPGRVAGADLVPELAGLCAEKGLSLFFLGGRKDVGQTAADILRKKWPELQVAGIESPYVRTEGEDMIFSEEQDEMLVARINATDADILLVAFGNPKQEIWFNRNRARLKIPVTIGVGGTFEFIAGTTRRAPGWMQQTGLEWLHRIAQDPGRLLKRYAVDLVKLCFLSLPLLVSHWRSLRAYDGGDKTARPHEAGETVVLPPFLDGPSLMAFADIMEERLADRRDTMLNFSRVRYISPAAYGCLVRLHYRASREEVSLAAREIPDTVKNLMHGARLWDYLGKRLQEGRTPQQAAPRGEDRFSFRVRRLDGVGVLALYGRLDALERARMDMDIITYSLGDGPVALDVSHLDFVDSSGLGFFLHLHRWMDLRGMRLHIAGAEGLVRQMFSITRLERVFPLSDTLDQAVHEALKKS